MNLLAVWLGKLTFFALRLIGRKGNALPGLVVERTFPRYLPTALSTLPQGVVIVSGTNGKTTTTKMVATLLAQRYRVLTNDTGSNFTRGAIAACVSKATARGRLEYDVAVFELDEAWAARFVEVVTPQRALLLNVMRDQLDRFGEIDTTARLLGKVAAATTGHLVLNRDDPRIASLPTDAQTSFYGVAPPLRPEFPNDEELYGGELYLSDQPAAVELLGLASPGHPEITLRVADLTHDVLLRAQGPHNAQNAAGAAAMALSFGFTPVEVFAGLDEVEPAFGRGQDFSIDGRTVALHLVKNPAGFRQSLRVLDGVSPEAIVLAINDDYADGRDMSWLWDVQFAALAGTQARISTSGTRAADMAVRLHYDEISVAAVTPRLAEAVREALAAVPAGAQVVVFSTYTAMWALHDTLVRMADSAVPA